jgi:hypothetical protein
MILLVVLSMLTLLALLGVSFVLYATSTRHSARLAVEAQQQRRPDIDPERLLSYFLGQLLFDVSDDEQGVYSALRGHSLGRDMLGLNYHVQSDGSIGRNGQGQIVDLAGNVLNEVPFNGMGRLRFDPRLPFPLVPDDSRIKDDSTLVNFMYFPADNFLRDPERKGWRPGLPARGDPDNRKPYAGGFNAPYTYPDLNHVYLAAVKADGRVLLPSFHRPWAGFGALGPSNWRWTSDIDPTLSAGNPLHNIPQAWLKYQVMRPRPIDMGPGFPLPEDDGGDIKNLIGAPGGNDSIWIDLGYPVLRAADGRKYKPLFAPLIVDLDGRVNLNVHGNLRGVDSSEHASNQGWGPWEVNPRQLAVLPDRTDPGYQSALLRRQEWARLGPGLPPATSGRYGWEPWPHSDQPGNVADGPVARFYAPIDFDGSRERATGNPSVVGRPSAKLRLPGARRTLPWQCFPSLPARAGYGNASAAERTNHPLLYNPFRLKMPDRAFPLSDLEALYRQGDTGGPALASSLLRLCPRNLLDPADPLESARRRRMVTLASFDPDRPGISPWFWTRAKDDPAYYRLPPREPGPNQSPYHPAGEAVGPLDHSTIFESEFAADGRTIRTLTARRRLDLNRYLPAYPNPETSGRIGDATAFLVAQRARQHMAHELFELFWRVTGAGDPALMPSSDARDHDTTRWDALRWLAQLAVNFVDFVDEDDYMTPFNWFTDPNSGKQEWVHGTELPRVLVNEVYAEYTNLPGDTGLNEKPRRATRLKGNVWVELYNPFRDDPPLTAPYRKAEAQLEMPPAGSQPAYGVYRLIVARMTNDIRQPHNVRGEITPSTGFPIRVLSTFSQEVNAPPSTVDTRVLLGADASSNRGYSAPIGENKGFYVIGPDLGPGETSPFPAGIETLKRSEMSYALPANYPRLLLKPSVLLQRLACPHLPPQPDPALPLYNPYITVDYVRDVETNYAAAVGLDGAGMPEPVELIARASVGRKQPYAAHSSQLKQQQPAPALLDQPQHSFFQHNVDSTTPGPNWRQPPDRYPPFDWLTHADRPLISAMELLHVSGFKPHELTQQFRTGDTDREKFTHRAPWFDEGLAGLSNPQSHRLYRLFEFLTTHNRSLGRGSVSTKSTLGLSQPFGLSAYPNQKVTPQAMSGVTPSGGTWRIEVGSTLVIDQGLLREEVVRVKEVEQGINPTWFIADFLRWHGAEFTITPTTISERVPGMINLNTVWDEEIFLALSDPNSANTFTVETARAMFKSLVNSRTVSGDVPGGNDQPFLGLAPGLLPGKNAASGLQDTLLRFENPGAQTRVPILGVPGQPHPYLTYELLTKIFNSTTVRSNVFAVWLTVGFFEVTDDRARPVKLGAEIGRAENRHVRHRMFAIVDRSVLLSNPGPQPRFDPRSALPSLATGPVVPYFSIID